MEGFLPEGTQCWKWRHSLMPMKSLETVTPWLQAAIPSSSELAPLQIVSTEVSWFSSCFTHTCGLKCPPGPPSVLRASSACASPSASTSDEGPNPVTFLLACDLRSLLQCQYPLGGPMQPMDPKPREDRVCASWTIPCPPRRAAYYLECHVYRINLPCEWKL